MKYLMTTLLVTLIIIGVQDAGAFWSIDQESYSSELTESPSCVGPAQTAKVLWHGGREYSVAYEHDTSFTEDCCLSIAQFERDNTRTVIQKFCLQKRQDYWFIFEAKDIWMSSGAAKHGPFTTKQGAYDIIRETERLLFEFTPE